MKEKATLPLHQSCIYSICILKDKRIASCSSDKYIKIFNLLNYKCEIVIPGHENNITYVSCLENGKLLSSSWDRTIKVWNIGKNDYHCDGVLEGHNGLVWKVIPLSRNRIASCSEDTTIRIWSSFPPYNWICTLNGHLREIFSIIQLRNRETLVSSSRYDESIRFWDLNMYNSDRIFQNVKCHFMNSLIELSNNVILIGGKNQITAINLSTNQLILILQDDFGNVSSFIELNDGRVLFSCQNESIYQLDINTYNYRPFKEEAHEKEINSILQINSKTIITCSDDRTIKIWEEI